jgi:radical SAM protein with 4Fe4S-binding SPASM domain
VLDLTDRIAQSVPSNPLRVESAEAREHLNRIFLKVDQRKIPFWTHLDLTYKCNTDCIHCYCQHLDPAFGGKYDKQDLTTAEIKGLLDQLADYGVLNLTLSGGELLVRKDFFEIAFYASREKHFALSFYTNGTLVNERIAARVAELCPVAVEISLQGATAEVHDYVVQRPGSFQRVIAAARMLRARGVNVVLKTTLMQPNFHQADELVRLAGSLGASAYRTSLDLTPKNDGDTSVQRFNLTDEQFADYIARDYPEPFQYREPISLEEARQRSTCGTGTVACYISPYGDVYPCIQLLISMGNIRERSFKEIWEAPSELRRKLEAIQTYGDLPDCQTCEYVQLCQRCHGLAYLETGDLTKCYKMVLRSAKLNTEVNARMAPKVESSVVPVAAGPMLIERQSPAFTSFSR